MKYFILLVKASITKEYHYLCRYKFNTVFSIALCSFIFLGLSQGHNYLKSSQVGSVSTLLSGYIVWLLMTSSLTSIVNGLVNETNVGTLEQLYLSSFSFHLTLIVKGLSSLLVTITQLFFVVIFITSFSASINLSFLQNFIIGIPLLLLGLPSILGISLIICSLALKYKNVTSFTNAISSILFAALSYSVHSSELIAQVFPFGLANYSLQRLYDLGEIPTLNILIAILINGIIYLSLGIVTFKIYEESAKVQGSFSKH